MGNEPVHVVVGTPCHGGWASSAYFSSVLRLQEACRVRGLGLTFLLTEGGDDVERARREILDSFLDIRGATHLFFIDADIGFEPDQAFRLLSFNADVAAAAYPLKRWDWERVRAAAREGRGDPRTAGLRYVVEPDKPPAVRDGFVRASLAGTGFFLARRSVFTRMADHYPALRRLRDKGDPQKGPWSWAFFDCLIDGADGPFLSEDYGFCRRWTAMGGEIWVDLSSRLDHVGLAVFSGDLSSAAPPDEGGEARE